MGTGAPGDQADPAADAAPTACQTSPSDPRIKGHPPKSRVLLQTSQQGLIFSPGCLSLISSSDALATSVVTHGVDGRVKEIGLGFFSAQAECLSEGTKIHHQR